MKRQMSWAEFTKRSEAMKARWADPEEREKLSAWQRSDECRQQMSALKRGRSLSREHVAAIKAGKARRKAQKSCE